MTREKAVCPSLIFLFVCCFADMQGQDNLTNIFLNSDNQNLRENTSISDTIIHFYGITTCLDTMHKVTLIPNVIVSAIDTKDMIGVDSDSFGYYDLPLRQNKKYTVYYEYNGMYTQFLELDTYSNTNISDKLEYLLPARITMSRNENPIIRAFYLDNPTEKIYLESRSEIFVKDKLYSDSFEAKLKKLQKGD